LTTSTTRLGRFIGRKAVKILANGLKPVFALDYRLRPAKRYRIPEFSPARRKRPARGPIPHLLWQTNYTNEVTLSVYVNYLFNRLLTPEFDYHYFTDERCDAFVRENYSGEIFEAFSRLKVGAARSDFWRVLVLLKHGGIYLDIDSNLSRPPAAYLDAATAELFLRDGNGEVTNYYMAAAPGHRALKAISDAILRNIQEGTITSVFHMTGPTVVGRVVAATPGLHVEDYRSICTQGQFTNKTFQYADKKHGAWVEEQRLKGILK
jgi:mannosyltransferase OCH1-like enzyme